MAHILCLCKSFGLAERNTGHASVPWIFLVDVLCVCSPLQSISSICCTLLWSQKREYKERLHMSPETLSPNIRAQLMVFPTNR
jgi:hypothetical protein